jgi:hypothetical protein
MFDRIHPTQWVTLPIELRDQIARDFHVLRTGVSEIRDQTLISDGRTMEDLAVINSETMSAYVGSEADFPRLWELTVAKARSILNPPVGVISELEPELPAIEPTHAKKARKQD